MMRRFDVAMLPGDGIGPEVMAQARRVLARIGDRHGFTCFLKEGLIGQAALDAGGRPLPPETLRLTGGWRPTRRCTAPARWSVR